MNLPFRSLGHLFKHSLFTSIITISILVFVGDSARATTIVVPAGGDLQAALNTASSGDTIIVDAQGTFNGSFVLRTHSGPCTGAASDYVTVQSSALASLPTGRVGPSDAGNMPKIVTTDPWGLASFTISGRCWKLDGLELTNNTTNPTTSFVEVNADHFVADHLLVHPKECPNITPPYTTTARFGFITNAADISIKHSYAYCFFGLAPGDVAGAGATQTNDILVGPDTNGLYVYDNYLEAWYTPILVGGADGSPTSVQTVSGTPTFTTATVSSTSGLSVGMTIAFQTPYSDTHCRNDNTHPCWANGMVTAINGNDVTFTSLVATDHSGSRVAGSGPPLVPGAAQWAGKQPTNLIFEHNTIHLPTDFSIWQRLVNGNHPKGYMESKGTSGLTFTANVCDGFPAAVGFTTTNQNGSAPWTTTANVTVRNNLITQFNVGFIFSLADYQHLATEGHDITVDNNLLRGPDNNGSVSGVSAQFIQGSGGTGNIAVTHNTVLNGYPDKYTGTIISWGPSGLGAYSRGTPSNVTVQNNLWGWGNYGFSNFQNSGGISGVWPGYAETKNLFALNVNQPSTDPAAQFPNSLTTPSWANVQFADANYPCTLQAWSSGHNAASDGKDIGTDCAALFAAIGGNAPTPTPTPTASPTPRSPASVERARDYAKFLISGSDSNNGSSGKFTLAAASDLISLTTQIGQTYSDFTAERNLFGAAADSVEKQILGALYFSRTAAALAGRLGISSSVKDHLRRIIAHLSMADDLMLYGSITPATAAQAAAMNARADLIVATVSSGYTPTSGALLATASLGSVFSNSGQWPLSTQSDFAALSSRNELPYELAGVSVAIGGQAVPVISVSPSRVTFFVPADLALGAAEVIVASQEGYVSRGMTTIAQNVFRIMTSAEDETGSAVAINSVRQTGNDLDVITPENFGSDKRTRITIFATGITGSAANNETKNDIIVSGVVQPNFAESVAVEARTADGRVIGLPVEFAGAQGTLPGLDQVNVVLLPELQGAGIVELTLIINGSRSNAPTIVVR
jgi:uncharacterized protein (TIGR03437 family)